MTTDVKNHSDKELIDSYLKHIKETALKIKRNVRIMEICGGHTNTIMKYGLREILPKNVKLISGPGCPVCVSSKFDIDCMIELAIKGVPVATYGDMMRVPGSKYSLEDAKAKTGKVFEVYSATEVIKLREKYSDIVFFGIGFETTAPMTTFLLKNGVCVYSVHKLVPPALKILENEDIDGFIEPGHVSAIIGIKPYEDINKPQVVAGFELEQIIRSVSLLLDLILAKENRVVNGYPEIVREEGNILAQKALKDHFIVADSEWRGFGVLPMSGLEVKNDKLNAKVKYKQIFDAMPPPKKNGCRCGDVLKGTIDPTECGLYRKVCNPDNPQGACMVSAEGSCQIAFNYGK